MYKYTQTLIAVCFATLGLNTSALADYYQDLADEMIANVASASNARDVFDATKGGKYGQMSRDFEFFLFQLYKQNEAGGVESVFRSSGNAVVNDEEYRNTLYELVALMQSNGILDKEMIELAKGKISASTHNSGPQYDEFAQLPEVVEFYDKKYNDKWVRIYSKEWVYAAAATDIVFEKANRLVELGERLQKEELVEFGEKLLCSLGSYNGSDSLCISTRKDYLAIKASADADESIKEAQLQAARDMAATEAQIEATRQKQRAITEIEEINENKQLQDVLMQQRADEEEARLQKAREERNAKIKETMNSIGIPDHLINEESQKLGVTQSNGVTVDSGLKLKEILMNLSKMGCEIKYSDSPLPNNKSYSVSANDCAILLKRNSYAGIPNDVTARSMKFSVAHVKYKLLDLYAIKDGAIGGQKLDSELTFVLLSGLKDQ